MKYLNILLCLSLTAGCVARTVYTPQPCPTPRTTTPQYPAQQYVPEYHQMPLPPVSEPYESPYNKPYPPPLGGPYFGLPPAIAPDGSSTTPFIGPDGVALCNEFSGVMVCQ